MRIRVITLMILVLALGACSEGGDRPEGGEQARLPGTPSDEFSPVIARVGDIEITQAYFDFRYEMLAPGDKARFSGEDWKSRYMDNLIEETILYSKAREENFHLIPEVEKKIDFSVRAIMVDAYYDKKFKDDIQPSDAQVQEYYDEHPDKFRKLGMVFGYLIRNASKAEIDKAHAALKDGERFAAVAMKYSDDPETKDKGGELGWFNPGGYVLGIGYNKTFTDRAFAMESGAPSEPFEMDGNWYILQTSSKSETSIQPLSEVRERIERTLRPVLAKEAYATHMDGLHESLDIARFGEYQEDEVRTAEQLYRLAGESRSPHAKLNYYQALVKKYPDHEYADDALFMIGFVNSEEFSDLTAAAVAFRKIIKEMPESDYVEDSRYMLRNLGQSNPNLRGREAPQNPDEAAGRVGELREGG